MITFILLISFVCVLYDLGLTIKLNFYIIESGKLSINIA